MAAAVLFAIGAYMEDANPHLRNIWKACALCGLGAFVLDTLLRRLDDKDTKNLTDELSSARQSDATLKFETEQLAVQLAEARRQSDDDRAARQELEKQLEATNQAIAPRTISPSQRRTLFAALKPFAGQGVEICAVMGDEESVAFALEFSRILRECGWQCSPESVFRAMFSGAAPIGIEVTISDKESKTGRAAEAARNLTLLVNEFGLVTERNTIYNNANCELNKIKLTIGSKPRQSSQR